MQHIKHQHGVQTAVKINPEISVVIITYNQEEFIGQTLEGALQQNLDIPCEIIVADDCSTDNNFEVITAFQKKYPGRIRAIRNEQNLGLLKNYKNAIETCRGKYIAVCGGDDFWHDRDKLKLQYSFLRENQDYAVIHCDYDLLLGNKLMKNYHKKMKTVIPVGDVFDELLQRNFIVASTTMFRADVFRKCVDLDDYISHNFFSEDYASWMEISKAAKIGYLNRSTTTYRVLAESLSRSADFWKVLKNFNRAMFHDYNYIARKHGAQPVTDLWRKAGFIHLLIDQSFKHKVDLGLAECRAFSKGNKLDRKRKIKLFLASLASFARIYSRYSAAEINERISKSD